MPSATCARVKAYIPDEFTAVRTEGRLLQEGSHEFVPVHLMNPPSHRVSSAVEALPLLEFPPWLFTGGDTADAPATDSLAIAACAATCLSICNVGLKR